MDYDGPFGGYTVTREFNEQQAQKALALVVEATDFTPIRELLARAETEAQSLRRGIADRELDIGLRVEALLVHLEALASSVDEAEEHLASLHEDAQLADGYFASLADDD